MGFMNIARRPAPAAAASPVAKAAVGAAPGRAQVPAKAMAEKKKPRRGNIGRMLREKLG